MVKTQFRQGDVFIEKVSARTKRRKKLPRDKGRIVLAYGETTGHAHAISDRAVEAYEFEGDMLLVVEGENVSIRHEEHSPITLPPGNYRVTRQREYSPEAIRQVAD